MSKHLPPSPPECRSEAIRLARTSGKPPGEIARELGRTGETWRLWLTQADLDEGKRSDGLTSDEQEEVRRLRRENRLLREERAILNKAAAPLPRRRPTRSARRLRVCGAREGQPCRRHSLAGCWVSPRAASGRGASAAAVGARRVRRLTSMWLGTSA
jgi:transposase